MKTQHRQFTQHSNNQSWFPKLPNLSQWLVRALTLSSAVSLGFAQRTPAKVFNVDVIPSNQKVIFTGVVNTDTISTAPKGLTPFEMGDINRDGLPDFAFVEQVDTKAGGSITNSTQNIYLVYGSAAFSETVDLTKLSLPQGVTFIRHVVAISQSRLLPLANAGDVSGDGFDDIVIDGDIMDSKVKNPDNVTRKIYWIAGGNITDSVIDLDNSPIVNLIQLIGIQDSALATPTIVGDIDQNGKNDILYCPYYGPQLIFMGVAPNTIFLNSSTLPEIAKFPVDPTGLLAQFSTTTTGSAAGDANGDGVPDFFVVLNSQPGSANLIFGRKFDRPVPLVNMTMADGKIIYAGTSNNPLPVYNEKNPLVFYPGNVLPSFSQNYYSKAGDVNNDRRADYMIGDPYFILPKTPQAISQSRTSIIFGTNSTNTLYLDELTQAQGISIIGLPTQSGSATYATGPAGDVDNDGNGDIYHATVINNSILHTFILFGGKLSGTVNLDALTAEQGILFTRNATGLGGNPEFYPSILKNINNKGYGGILIPIGRLNNNLGIDCNAAVLLKGEAITSLASGSSGTQQQPTTDQQTSSTVGQTGTTTTGTTIPTVSITAGTGNTGPTTGVAGTSKNATMSATSDVSDPTSSTTAATTTAKTTINAASSQFSGIDFIYTFLLINMVARLTSDFPFFVNLLAGLGASVSSSKGQVAQAQAKMPIDHDTVIAATQRGVFRPANSAANSSRYNNLRGALTIEANDRGMSKATTSRPNGLARF